MYLSNKRFSINTGFTTTAEHVERAAIACNNKLRALPHTLYTTIDFKTTSAIIGCLFCEELASEVGAITNPIEKGHPDIVPTSAKSSSEERLRKYPQGIEIKTTIGNIKLGANLRAGEQRVEHLTGITWQAHHREVEALMGLAWDFVQEKATYIFPGIAGVFYSNELTKEDWGEISGTSGRNTKVCGMKASGKKKMGTGCILLLKEEIYIRKYNRLLGTSLT